MNKNSLMTLKSTAVSLTLSRVEPEIFSGNLRLNYLKIKFYDEQGTMIHVRNLSSLSFCQSNPNLNLHLTYKILKGFYYC